jgi:hypothetical protein
MTPYFAKAASPLFPHNTPISVHVTHSSPIQNKVLIKSFKHDSHSNLPRLQTEYQSQGIGLENHKGQDQQHGMWVYLSTDAGT